MKLLSRYDRPMDKTTKILRVAVATPLWQSFDYLAINDVAVNQLQPGSRIKIPFGRREVVGVLLAVADRSTVPPEKLKPIIEILDDEPLIPATLLKLYQWASDYYHYPIGEVVVGTLPKSLREGKPAVITANTAAADETTPSHLELNGPQRDAINAITHATGFQTFLLAGVTGSGKTEVYLNCIDNVLTNNKQALVLVPEIALTPQTVARFRQRFNVPIELIHSNLTAKTRMQAWLKARRGDAAIIIGTRSAIFTPLLNPGMIILDEEHDPSFKQQSGFRYSARDLAVMRAQIENIPVILGSATPSLESLYNAQCQRYHLLRLPKRAGNIRPPDIKILDLRQQHLESGLSQSLLKTIATHLTQHGQVMLFLNRRGYAPTMMCHGCGWIVLCHRCDARLTLHQNPKRLRCHHCGTSKLPPRVCPACQHSELMSLGIGTEQLENALHTHFPHHNIVRIDRDSTRKKGSMNDKLQRIHDSQADILIGTQMLAKGHHFANLTLVAIVNADSGLFSADFRSLERMAQLLVQVAGRAGREKRGEVIVQTHHPTNPLLQLLLQKGYTEFALALLNERKLAAMPPFAHLALLRAEAVQSSLPMEFLQQVKQILDTQKNNLIQIYGPVPATMERKAGKYRSQLLLQSPQRAALHTALKPLMMQISTLPTTRRVRWSLDIDPQEII